MFGFYQGEVNQMMGGLVGGTVIGAMSLASWILKILD
jgi:predicted lipid-binding transport protein (Tim44 family)